MQRFYDNDGFNFATLIALGSTYRGLADVGESVPSARDPTSTHAASRCTA
jgi:hypothetical protein